MTNEMQRNIEIKAKLKNKQFLLEKIARIQQETKNQSSELEQTDTFYNANVGRLKLRTFGKNLESELIAYERPDEKGPKTSHYTRVILPKDIAEQLDKALSRSLGISTQVKKHRMVYLFGQSRIHIDHVEKLGDFVEIEVVLRSGQSIEEGQKIMQSLMEELNIQSEDLIEKAYADLLQK